MNSNAIIDMAVNWPQRRAVIDLALCKWWPV
jgi:hypothetical protein